MRRRSTWWILAALLLLFATPALAWGPATHTFFSTLTLEGSLGVPAAVLALLRRRRAAFLYGAIAPDEIVAKGLCDERFHCHRWDVGFRLLDESRTETQRAFSLGYLTHLAADVIAHNGYVPTRLRQSDTTLQLGHTYWEVRADRLLDPSYLAIITQVRKQDQSRNQALMERIVLETIFSHRTNRRICDGMYRISSGKSWSRVWRLIDRYSRYELPASEVREFHRQSLIGVRDVLVNGRRAAIVERDPIGESALRRAARERRVFRWERRTRVVQEHLPEGARRWLEARRLLA
ncbi:MAG: zinc dependent phospholipase C family protein [Planctomycetes bacterium]|nr:zinc dependent phospholipase C family protein [Planctomycetota bacterium]MBI3846381.1 zinc dependent phospholipase C family protein [Planctomycetota bacterium]